MWKNNGLAAAALALFLGAQDSAREGQDFRVHVVEGFTVHVARELSRREPALAQEALRLLDTKLYEVGRVVPADALVELRRVALWLELESKDPCAVYHPSRQWLVEHDYNPDKAEGVEIANARNFLRWTLDQPAMLIHELMHAYHHQVLGYEHAGIRAAYEAALTSTEYDAVLHINGQKRRAYALENEKEYFAEICEAWFGTNDFYPFVKAELRLHDPTGYALLESLFPND